MNRTAILHYQKPIPPQPSPLLWLVGAPGDWSDEAMCGALGKGALLPEIPAADVKDGIHVKLAFVLPNLRKGYVLGVADEPGGLMIKRGRSVFQRSDTKGDWEAATLGAQSTAGGDGGIRHCWGLDSYSHALPGREKRARRA